MGDGEIPPHLRSTAALLKKAYPSGLPPEDYKPLIAVLYEEMSQRNLANVLSKALGLDYHRVLNVVGVETPAASELDRIRQKLGPFGYDDWLKEE